MLLGFRSPITGRRRVGLTHISAFLRVSVILGPGEMVDLRLYVDPDDGR